jgi:hypothetical protein
MLPRLVHVPRSRAAEQARSWRPAETIRPPQLPQSTSPVSGRHQPLRDRGGAEQRLGHRRQYEERDEQADAATGDQGRLRAPPRVPRAPVRAARS